MRLHQNDLQINTSFATAQYLDQISKDLIQTKHERLKSKTLNLPLFDRTNRIHSLVLDEANICILGENPNHRLDLSLHIQEYYAGKERQVLQISLNEFSNLLLHERKNPNFTYIVEGSSADLSIAALTFILGQFTNIFVFALPGLKLACSYSGNIYSTPRSDEISFALGRGSYWRKYLLSTLNEHEFVAITGSSETIRTLNKSKKIVSFKRRQENV